MAKTEDKKSCINCGKPLFQKKGAWVCLHCNPEAISISGIFDDDLETEDHVFIECPGATLYDPETGEVEQGVKWRDDDDASKGYTIVNRRIFAPDHKRRRRIRKEALGKIRRCRACQDYTIRMRRPEGRDFFIPSAKHPHRKKLKPVTHVSSR